MTAFTIIAYVMGLVVSLSLLFGLISLIDGFVNKLPSKVKMGTILLTVAVALSTIGGIHAAKKVFQQRKLSLYYEWVQADCAHREFTMHKCMMTCKGDQKDSTCCAKGDTTKMKCCDASKTCKPGTCEHHK
ncbi:MAG: hypothetical protein WCH34_03300 [Bacteroidota bacterium]